MARPSFRVEKNRQVKLTTQYVRTESELVHLVDDPEGEHITMGQQIDRMIQASLTNLERDPSSERLKSFTIELPE